MLAVRTINFPKCTNADELILCYSLGMLEDTVLLKYSLILLLLFTTTPV